ncbi:hypothetical protein [Cloacibacillus porcorum]
MAVIINIVSHDGMRVTDGRASFAGRPRSALSRGGGDFMDFSVDICLSLRRCGPRLLSEGTASGGGAFCAARGSDVCE